MGALTGALGGATGGVAGAAGGGVGAGLGTTGAGLASGAGASTAAAAGTGVGLGSMLTDMLENSAIDALSPIIGQDGKVSTMEGMLRDGLSQIMQSELNLSPETVDRVFEEGIQFGNPNQKQAGKGEREGLSEADKILATATNVDKSREDATFSPFANIGESMPFIPERVSGLFSTPGTSPLFVPEDAGEAFPGEQNAFDAILAQLGGGTELPSLQRLENRSGGSQPEPRESSGFNRGRR